MSPDLPSAEPDRPPSEPPSAATVSDWYDAFAGKLLLYGRALGLGHGEAEDVLQDVFVALLRGGGIPEDPEHYLVRAYRNRVVNHRRGWWRRIRREFESLRWFEPTIPASPQEAAAVRCLQGLPVAQREVVVLKIWHGYTFAEIGGLQGITANTAAGRYRYGLLKLRACLRTADLEPRENEDDPKKQDDHERPLRTGIRGTDAAPLALAAVAAAGRRPA